MGNDVYETVLWEQLEELAHDPDNKDSEFVLVMQKHVLNFLEKKIKNAHKMLNYSL